MRFRDPLYFLRAQDSETFVLDTEISRLAKNLLRHIIFQGPFFTRIVKSNFFLQLKKTMYGSSVSADDPLFQRVWTHSSNPAKEFLLTLGFDQVTAGDQKVLRLKWDFEHVISLEDVYVAVFVLCSK